MPLSQFVEDIACQNVYTLMILKRSDRFRWAWLVRSKMYVRYITINDESKYKSKDHLFIFKTTIMVNKREKIYCIISISDKRLSSFFFSLILSLSFYFFFFFFPYLFRFNFIVSERNVHILFCQHIWVELPLLFWTFLSGTLFPGRGRGGALAPSAAPPACAPEPLFIKSLMQLELTRQRRKQNLILKISFQGVQKRGNLSRPSLQSSLPPPIHIKANYKNMLLCFGCRFFGTDHLPRRESPTPPPPSLPAARLSQVQTTQHALSRCCWYSVTRPATAISTFATMYEIG